MRFKKAWGTTEFIGIALAVVLLIVLVIAVYMLSKGTHVPKLSGP